MEILSHSADHLYYQFLLVDSLFSRGFTKLLPPSDVVHTSSWTSIDKFRLQFVSTLYLLFLYMATHTTDGVPRMIPALSSMTPTDGTNTHLQPDDPTSASYIPRVARMTPTSTTVHTIFIKKLSYPLTSRPDELWILERTADGRETWKPVETSGKHAPHEGPCYIANHCQPLAPVLRDTYPIILLLYNNILPGSTTSRTYQHPRLTAVRGHP